MQHVFVAVVGDVAIALLDQHLASGRILRANMIQQGASNIPVTNIKAQVSWPARHLLQAVQNHFLRIRVGLVTKEITVVSPHQPGLLDKSAGFFLKSQRYANTLL